MLSIVVDVCGIEGDSWQSDMESTKVNLAPRGYGRSSFRFAE